LRGRRNFLAKAFKCGETSKPFEVFTGDTAFLKTLQPRKTGSTPCWVVADGEAQYASTSLRGNALALLNPRRGAQSAIQ